jgi:bifunctional non-homologous end joining protein LigD
MAAKTRGTSRRKAERLRSPARTSTPSIVKQLEDIERSGGDGTIRFSPRSALHVSSLDKLYFPDDGITKGDVMRYYAAVAPVLLPIIKDRPLILNRFPDGIAGESFFQQNAGDNLPAGVRTAKVVTESGKPAVRIIGGDLLTLLYTVQIGTIAVHTWQARLQSRSFADTTTIDLDPGTGVKFSDVVALARAIKLDLDEWELSAGIKTSGSSGVHIVLPMPPKMPFEFAARVAQVVAERTARKNPTRATVERSIETRPRGSIYVDAQQNAEGKSVVAAYSVRARAGATVSAPLDWSELRRTLRLDTFTIESIPDRVRKVGDLWGAAMTRRNSKRALDRLLRDANDGR